MQETLRQFTQAFNQVCAYGWHHKEKNGVKLHHALYYETKAACPGLVSDHLIQARVKATEALRSAFTWKLKKEQAYPKKDARAKKLGKPIPKFKPVKCPQSVSCAVRYNVHTYSLNWEWQTVNLASVAGRLTLPFTVPHWSRQYAGNPIATADLIYRKGK